MKQYLNIRGSQEVVSNLEINLDTVYLRNNITRIESEDFTGWQYDEIQYSLREYQEIVGNKTNSLELENAELWFENILLKVKSEYNEQEIAELWYQTITGGNV